MTPIEKINKEFNNRFIINSYYDEITYAPTYYITDKINNKQYKTLPIQRFFSDKSLTNEYIYNILIETINNIISDNRNININELLNL